MTDRTRYTLLALALLAIAGVIYYLEMQKPDSATANADIQTTNSSIIKDMTYPRAKEIVNPDGFINTESGTDGRGSPVKIADYIGKKVILVDFLTYSCINCVRVQPYLNAWYEKYAEQGLQIIGIHTPEFEFEKDYRNVSRAMEDMGVKYPVVLDNNYGTWRAYQNSYWPRKYLIDIDGYVVYDHIGEGGYDETEGMIQKLLNERASRLREPHPIASGFFAPPEATGVSAGISYTPETYFGAVRNARYLGNGNAGVVGTQTFVAPAREKFETHTTYLDGPWRIESEYAEGQLGSKILLRFQGKKVFVVAGSARGAKLTVRVDGKLYTEADVQDGNLFVQDERLYTIVELPEWGEHLLEIIVQEGNPQIFTFTFG